ncbi:glycoside hydrolase family 20 protein [Terrimonas alba]|uniref:glycoside hydrolase family 20 protein n=1 Tax=Terrimonas alba TaxID=3349636 RepID=UPI0035F4B495
MRLTFVLTGLVLFSCCLQAQDITVVPKPVSIKQPRIAAKFSITPATQIVLEGSNLEQTAALLNEYLQQFYLFKLKVVKKAAGNNAIRLNYERMDNPVAGAYRMTVDNKGVYIAGDNANGVFYGIQTLIQLLPVPDAKMKMRPAKLYIPHVSIEDSPRFAYRGLHLDVGRHFFPVKFIKKYIDYIAYYKLNTFHWHLTEDQGWRIEIKKYPKLTSVGGWRNGTIIGRYPGTGNDNTRYDGFYTQQEIKEIVNYAKARFVEVIPEIEMPGHGSAAIAAYPWLSCFPNQPTAIPANMISSTSVDQQAKGRIKLVQETWGVFDDVFCAGNDSTFLFLQNVIDEVLPLFPSKYFHVGGDECPKTHWKKCPRCQQRMKEHNLKDEHELQSYFIQRIEKYLNSKGKTLIGWDEILEGGLAPKAVVMSWRGEEGGIAAAKQKHDVIMTPGNPVYFDHTQSLNEDSVTIGGYNPLEKVYAYNPVPKELNADESKYVLGAQANLWTEYMKNPRKVEYMLLPRLTALSEVLWSPLESKNWDDFETRLPAHFKRFDLWNANYSKAYFDLKTTVQPSENNVGVQWKLESKHPTAQTTFKQHAVDEPFAGQVSAGEKYNAPITITATGAITGWNAVNGKMIGNPITQKFYFNKATGKKITLTTEPSNNYPGDGAFTLVNGVQNEKGLGRSREFLGWSGDDLEAVIDLGATQNISNAVIHSLVSGGSWIYPPQSAEIFVSTDGQNFSSVGKSENFEKTTGSNGVIKVAFSPISTRYIKVVVKNLGKIPDDKPGAGNKPWLFVDEIEVN